MLSSPNSSIFNKSSDSLATFSLILPSCLTIAKSATLLISLFAILGVPLERIAIAFAPSVEISISRILAVLFTTLVNSSIV